jgi:hypothetical protein
MIDIAFCNRLEVERLPLHDCSSLTPRHFDPIGVSGFHGYHIQARAGLKVSLKHQGHFVAHRKLNAVPEHRPCLTKRNSCYQIYVTMKPTVGLPGCKNDPCSHPPRMRLPQMEPFSLQIFIDLAFSTGVAPFTLPPNFASVRPGVDLGAMLWELPEPVWFRSASISQTKSANLSSLALEASLEPSTTPMRSAGCAPGLAHQ